jgi:magnesium-transporting ATPase (P-type)
MTGDGINDAPALRLADIGFALGSGTCVAREAGDIIILDDNLASVVKAVLYGRNIFKSIRKFITLQLTMNFSAVGVSMICPFFGIDAPVTVVQMLWVNLIMDTLGGLAFAGEAARPALLREPPKRRDEPILCGYMANQIALLGGFTVVLCLAFLYHPALTTRFRAAGDDIYLLTGFFAFFIFSGVLNCFNARTDRLSLLADIGRNPAFLGIMATVAVVQIAFVYLGGPVLRTAPLTASELAAALGTALLVIPAEFVRKLIWRALYGRRGY